MSTCRRSSLAAPLGAPGVRWDEHRDAFAGDLLHLALVPVAGVGEHDLGIAEPERGELALGGADHRFEMPEVRGLGGDLGGDDDLAVVDRKLRVVPLHPRLSKHYAGVIPRLESTPRVSANAR